MTKKYTSLEHNIRNIMEGCSENEPLYLIAIPEENFDEFLDIFEEQLNYLNEDYITESQLSQTANALGGFALDMTPIVGTAREGNRALGAWKRGEYLGALGHGLLTTISGLGDIALGIPIVGAGAAAGLKGLAFGPRAGLAAIRAARATRATRAADATADAARAADATADAARATKAADATADAARATGRGRLAKFAAAAGVISKVLGAMTPGQGGADTPTTDSNAADNTTDASKYMHMAKPYVSRQQVKEDATEERSKIENVARPNSRRDKAVKQQEIQKKIIEEKKSLAQVVKKNLEDTRKEKKNSTVIINPTLNKPETGGY